MSVPFLFSLSIDPSFSSTFLLTCFAPRSFPFYHWFWQNRLGWRSVSDCSGSMGSVLFLRSLKVPLMFIISCTYSHLRSDFVRSVYVLFDYARSVDLSFVYIRFIDCNLSMYHSALYVNLLNLFLYSVLEPCILAMLVEYYIKPQYNHCSSVVSQRGRLPSFLYFHWIYWLAFRCLLVMTPILHGWLLQ